MNATSATRRINNTVVLGGGELGSRLIAFVATAYLATLLGPDGFGVLGFAFAVVSYLSVFVDAGFSDIGSRDVARRTSDVAILASSVTLVRIGVATICFAALTTSVWIVEANTERSLVLTAMSLLLFAAALDTSWVFKGLERGFPVSVSLVLRRFLYAGLVFVFIGGPENLLAAPLVQFIGELLGVIWLGHRLFARGIGRIDLALGWRTFRSCGVLIFTKLLRTSIITLDVVLLGLMSTDRAVGLYSAPYRFCFLLMAMAGAIQVAYLPDIARSALGPERRAAAIRHLEFSSALGIPLGVGGVFVAAHIIQLIFGADYLEGTLAFQLLLCSVAVQFLFAPLHNILLAQNRLRCELWAFAVAAMLNLLLNVVWIPIYGITGAAWATLIAEMVILVWTAVAVWPAMGMSLLRPLAPAFVASSVMIAALLALSRPTVSVFLSVPVGITTYIGCLFILRSVPEDAMSAVRRLAQRCRPT